MHQLVLECNIRFAERQNGAGARRVREATCATQQTPVPSTIEIGQRYCALDEVPNTVRYNNGNLQWGH